MAATTGDDGEGLRAFLADPATHGIEGTVAVIETHANLLFLAGAVAYKLKKPVRFPFLDYSTVALREAACRRELTVNHANAPEIYRDVVAVRRGADGRLRLGGPASAGEAVDWLVRMTRFDETRTLDRLIAAGPLDDRLVERLAGMVAEAHGRAAERDAAPWIEDLAAYVEQNDAAFRAAPALFPPRAVEALGLAARQWHGRIAALLAERGRLGAVRLTHGDLHAGNVVLIGDRPVLFDAIEFDDAVATADLVYDAAFLIMDLDERGHRAEANLFVDRWLFAGVRAEIARMRRRGSEPEVAARLLLRQVEGLAALPFFLMLRAAIRAKVTAARAEVLAEAARTEALAAAQGYFAAAAAYLEPAEPVLVAIGGLSGSGKSTLARALAPRIGRAPGALRPRSDAIRKLLAGADEGERLPPEAYAADRAAAVYDLLAATARAGLAAGRAVIVDAVAARPEERAELARVAAGVEARFVGLWLEAPPATLIERVAARRGDVSDADEGVVRKQLGFDTGPIDWIRIDAGGGREASLAQALAALAAAGVAIA